MIRKARRVPVAIVTLLSFVSSIAPRAAWGAEEARVASEAKESAAAPKGEAPVSDKPQAPERTKTTLPSETETGPSAQQYEGASLPPPPQSFGALSLPTGADKSGVTSQAISVPQGPGKLQGMGESFSTQLSTGIATYSIPISLPAARGHAQPSLALSYSSGLGHGIAGVGWDLGVPSISRQTDRGLPQYQDPASGSDWSPNQDRFVFNGGQELVPICVVDTSTTCSGAVPGEQMPTWSGGYMYFRPRVEGSYQRFFWSPDRLSWRVQDKSGVTMELGVPSDDSSINDALELDPTGTKIFRWNLTREYDSNGGTTPVNVVQFRYFSDAGITYLTDIYDTPPTSDPPWTVQSYAHHTRVNYEQRNDRPSSYRRGWETHAAYRVSQIDVSSFASTPGANREMVRRYYLTYDATWHASYLTSVQMEGRCTDPTTEDDTGAIAPSSCPRLPPISLTYQHVSGFTAGGDPQGSDLTGYESFDERMQTLSSSPSHSLDENLTDLFDIDSDGLPDVLVTAPGLYNGNHGVYFNHGSSFAAVTQMAVNGVLGANAGDISLDNTNVLPTDIDGDAIVNLLHMPLTKQYAIYTPTLTGTAWAWQGRVVSTASDQNPKVNFQQNRLNTKVMDVNADGLVDVVFSSGTDFQTFLSLGRYPTGDGQFGSAQWTSATSATISNDPASTCVPWASTPVKLSDPDIRIGDMNGDGLPDIVRVRNGDLIYWPGRGNGIFGTGDLTDCPGGTFSQGREVRMDPPPHWLDPDVSKIRIDDVNGDGLDDFVQVRFNAVDIWLNVDGTGWTSQRHTVAGVPTSSITNRVRLVDMNGSGTRDILWGDGGNYRFVDLAGGAQPGLLVHVENGLGKTTDIQYSTSTSLMNAARTAGTPWTSVMPMVAHVVTKMTEHDGLGAIGRPEGAYVTEYEYANPVYDGRQREFRGFTTARARKDGDGDSLGSTTESTFLLGQCVDETPDNGIDECSLAERWRDNPREALKGLPYLNESFDVNNVYTSTQHRTYLLRQLYFGLDGRSVRDASEFAVDSYLYETSPFASGGYAVGIYSDNLQTTPTATAYSDTYDLVQLKSASYVHTYTERGVDLFGNLGATVDEGCDFGCTPLDQEIIHYMNPTLVTDDPGGWNWRTSSDYVYAPTEGVVRHYHNYLYDTAGNLLYDQGIIQGTLPIHRFHELGATVAALPAEASTDTTVNLASNTYDAYGNLTHVTAPNGRCRAVGYDSSFAQLPTSETIYAGAVVDGCGATALTATASYDRGLGVATSVTDVHGSASNVGYDGFGRVTSINRPDPSTGAAASLASVSVSYSLTTDPVGQPYSVVHTQTQDGADPSVSSYRNTYAYVDGMGRTIMGLDQADTSAGDGGDWVVSGLVDYDVKGALRRVYMPWFHTGDPSTIPLTGIPPTRYQRQRYDGFGRLIESYGLDGTIVMRTAYHAISKDVYDGADLQPGPHANTPVTVTQDGHGRVASVTERAHVGTGIEQRTTTTQYVSTGEPISITRQRGGDSVTRWMVYDTLGRLMLNVEPNTTKNFNPDPSTDPSTFEAWRYAYNDNGDLVATSDARGCGENFSYDAAGRLVGEDYSPCLASHVDYSAPDPTTGEGYEVLNRYDSVDPDVPDALPTTSGFMVGRLASVTDRGSKALTSYDGRGRVVGVSRRVAKPDSTGAALADRFAPRWYTKLAQFDAADRPVLETTGAQATELLATDSTSAVTTAYTKRGVVANVGSSYGALVNHVYHDADGRALEIQYGDLASTTTDYGYDERRRLSAVQTYRGPPAAWTDPPEDYSPAPGFGGAPSNFQLTLEDASFAYDVSDNPTEIHDWRNPDEWPDSAKPVSRKIQYDDLSRVTKVDYQYAAGTDVWTDPFYNEDTGANTDTRRANPSPHVVFDHRALSQTFAYDWLGNTTATSDDAQGFYDRSLGTITNDSTKAYQLTAAQNEDTSSSRPGHLTTAYDDAGNLLSMAVARAGTCIPDAADCGQRFVYEWDEAGRLSRARRWDLVDPGAATDTVPDGTASVELRYAYDGGGNRVLKTAVDDLGAELNTVYALGSMELRRAAFADGDYVDDRTTEVDYLSTDGINLARLHYSDDDLPTLSSGHLHVLFEIADHLGSRSIVLDGETGELVERSTYLGQGSTDSDYRTDRWESFREDYGFTGKEEDVEVGLTYFGARYYVPGTGRFASPDPLAIHGLGADLNVYAYVSGRLLSAVDPLGLAETGTETSCAAECSSPEDPHPANNDIELPDVNGKWSHPDKTLRDRALDTAGNVAANWVDPIHTNRSVARAASGYIRDPSSFDLSKIPPAFTKRGIDLAKPWWLQPFVKDPDIPDDPGSNIGVALADTTAALTLEAAESGELQRIAGDTRGAIRIPTGKPTKTIPDPVKPGATQNITEPTLPKRVIAQEGDVTIEHNYHGGDHGPAHAHVTGGGPTTRIGDAGNAIKGQPEPTAAQQEVIDANRGEIRNALKKIGRWLWYKDQ